MRQIVNYSHEGYFKSVGVKVDYESNIIAVTSSRSLSFSEKRKVIKSIISIAKNEVGTWLDWSSFEYEFKVAPHEYLAKSLIRIR